DRCGALEIDQQPRLFVDVRAQVRRAADERHPEESPKDEHERDGGAGGEHDALARLATEVPLLHRLAPAATICSRPSTTSPSGFANSMRTSKRSPLSISRANASSAGTSGT